MSPTSPLIGTSGNANHRLNGGGLQGSALNGTKALLNYLDTFQDRQQSHRSIEALDCLVNTILTSEHEKEAARNLQGDEAITLLDFMHSVLANVSDNPQHFHTYAMSRFSLRRLTANLAKKSHKIPTQLSLDGRVTTKIKNSSLGGPGSDIYEGQLEGVGTVFVKVLRIPKGEPTLRDLARESLAFSTLRHANIICLLGVDRTDGNLALITPWMKNGSLISYQKTRRQPLGMPSLLTLLRETVQGIAFLHAENVVHGDIKADNVLVDDRYHARLCDFGLSIFSDATNIAQTNHGGTCQFIAPEIHDCSLVDSEKPTRTNATDIYSLAMLIFQAYTYALPFGNGYSEGQIALKVIKNQRPPKPNHDACHGRNLPDWLWNLMRMCWATQPWDRPTIVTVAHEFEQIL